MTTCNKNRDVEKTTILLQAIYMLAMIVFSGLSIGCDNANQMHSRTLERLFQLEDATHALARRGQEGFTRHQIELLIGDAPDIRCSVDKFSELLQGETVQGKVVEEAVSKPKSQDRSKDIGQVWLYFWYKPFDYSIDIAGVPSETQRLGPHSYCVFLHGEEVINLIKIPRK